MALPSKQSFQIPSAGEPRSIAEPKVTNNQISTQNMQDDLYEYLDRDGNNYPGAKNTGLESEYIAPKAVKSFNWKPQMSVDQFGGNASFTIDVSTPVFISQVFEVNVPSDEPAGSGSSAEVFIDVIVAWRSAGDQTAAINFWIEASSSEPGTSSWTAGQGNRVGRAVESRVTAPTSDYVASTTSLMGQDRISQNTQYYRIVAKQLDGTVGARDIDQLDSTIKFTVTNGVESLS